MAYIICGEDGLYLMKDDGVVDFAQVKVSPGKFTIPYRFVSNLRPGQGVDLILNPEFKRDHEAIERPEDVEQGVFKQGVFRVVLDPGHGENGDPGAIGPGGAERDLVLKQAEIIADLLRKAAITVTILENRDNKSLIQIGRSFAESDCAISLHLNAANREAQGHEIYIHLYGTNTDFLLARAINSQFIKQFDGDLLPDRGVKRANFQVLTSAPTSCKAVCLVESFFIDSASKTQADDWIQTSAQAIANGIMNFLLEA